MGEAVAVCRDMILNDRRPVDFFKERLQSRSQFLLLASKTWSNDQLSILAPRPASFRALEMHPNQLVGALRWPWRGGRGGS